MRRGIVVAVLVALCAVGVAATVSLDRPQQPTFSAQQRCSNNDIEVVIDADGAAFDLPEACQGQLVEVRVTDGSIEGIGNTASGQASNLVEIEPGIRIVTDVFLSVGTWPLPVSWDQEMSEVIECLSDCFIEDLDIHHVNDIPEQYIVEGKISSDSPEPVRWQLQFNASSDELPFFADLLIEDRDLFETGDSFSCSADPRLVLLNPKAEYRDTVEAGRSVEFLLFGFRNVDDSPSSSVVYACD